MGTACRKNQCPTQGLDYPLNAYTDQLSADTVLQHQELAKLGENREWDKLIEKLTPYGTMINTAQLPVRNESSTCLYTPLHYAAEGGAPKEVFEKLLDFGALKCLKTSSSETAFDIGKRKGLGPDILELIQVPDEVAQIEKQIQAMESGLHEVIKDLVQHLLEETGQALPQLAVLYEKNINKLYYMVMGMFGGYHIVKVRKGIQVDSFIRIYGGSEMRHLIERDGKVTRLPFPDQTCGLLDLFRFKS